MLPALTLVGALRYDLIRKILGGLEGVGSILEIGPGVGAVGARLAREYEYVGVEQDRYSAEIARRNVELVGGGHVIHGTTRDLDKRSFDLVCAFEVLEHIEDDRAALREWQTFIRPGGWLMLSVPAWSKRFGRYDELAGHLRRYGRADLEHLANQCGFEDPVTFAYGFPLGNLLQKVWNRKASRTQLEGSPAERTAASGRWRQPRASLGWATRAAVAPFAASQRRLASRDLGIGLILVARRPSLTDPGSDHPVTA